MTNVSKHLEYYNKNYEFPNEQWEDYGIYYRISNYGRVYSLRYDKILKLRTRRHGYFALAVYNGDGKQSNQSIHRLVAELFCENKYNKYEVNHIDGDKQNNYYKNLEWCTHKQNIEHSFTLGHRKPANGECHGNSKLTEKQVFEIKDKYIPHIYPARRLAKEYGISKTNVLDIVNNKIWSHLS